MNEALNLKLKKLEELSAVLNSDSKCPVVYTRFVEFIQVYEEAKVLVDDLQEEVNYYKNEIEKHWRGENV